MARIKFGNIVVDMRGKVSGNVYSKNKGGAYSRVRVVPTNPRSSAQNVVRAVFTFLSQSWAALTSDQRNGWSQAAINFPAKNSLGDTHTLSGNALFVSLNKNLSDVNISPIADAPSKVTVASMDVPTIVASSGAQTVIATLVNPIPATSAIKVFASPAMSPGISSIGSKLRQIGVLDPAATSPATLTPDYLAKFGTVGAVGQKIFFEFVPVDISNGQLGTPIRMFTEIAA